MSRTGARASALRSLLASADFTLTTAPSAPRLADLSKLAANAALELYRELGGTDSAPRLRPGRWDIAVSAGNEIVMIELDEELHFNRYRERTLEATWNAHIPWAADYRDQCRRHERRCLEAGTWGKRWTTPGAEAFFGPASPAGQLAGSGGPRWKQRALYDAIKDLTALCGAAPALARLSIHDRLGSHNLDAVLTTDIAIDPERVRQLVEERTLRSTGANQAR